MGVRTGSLRSRFLTQGWLAVGLCALTGLLVQSASAQDAPQAPAQDEAAKTAAQAVADAPDAAEQRAADDPAFRAQAKSTQPFNRMIQTLIVTARKTEERIQQVPVALTAIPSEELASSNRRRLDDIQNQVPNLLIDQGTFLANTARVSLRGLGQNQASSAADPVVGIYVDGVYRPRLQASLISLFDVDRVEVLRGPQGTLFGKNTIGGAISITTKAPKFDFGGDGEVRVGNFGLLETRGSLNIPLIPEKAAARISVATATRDGYIKNVKNGDDYLDNKLLGGRFQLLVLPRENVEVNFAAEKTREDRKPFGAKCVVLGNGSGIPGLIANDPDIGFRKACAEDSKRSELKTAGDLSFTNDELDTLGLSNRVTWDITPDITLTSITGFRRQEEESFFNIDATEVPLLQFDNKGGMDTQTALSQEFQLTGITFEGRLRYVLGAFAFREKANETDFQGVQFMPNQPDVTGRVRFAPTPANFRNLLKVTNKSLALYGQATYSITERLDLTLGLRLTKDAKRVFTDTRFTSCKPGASQRACQMILGQGAGGANSFTGFERTGRFDDLSPAVTLAYAFSPKILVYGSASTAFQSGGFDGLAASIQDTRELENMEVASYEVGLKSTFFNDRLLFNASLFLNDLNDGTRVSVPRITTGGQLAFSQSLNSDATVEGAEVELGILPLPGLSLRSAIGLQKAELDDFDEGKPLGLSDGRLPLVPALTMNFMLDYEKSLGSLGTFGLNTSWSHRGRMNPVIQGTRELQISKYGLLDGRVSLQLPDGQTEIAAFGTNLLDRRYFFAGFSNEATFGFGQRFFGPPRFYGLELRRKF